MSEYDKQEQKEYKNIITGWYVALGLVKLSEILPHRKIHWEEGKTQDLHPEENQWRNDVLFFYHVIHKCNLFYTINKSCI